MLDLEKLTKYVLEGLAVAAAAFYIPQRNIDLKEVAIIGLTAAAVFAVLDHFAPSVSAGARHGAGFGIGYNIATGFEGFDDVEEQPAEVPHGDETSESETESESESDSEGEDEADNVPVGEDSGEPFASIM